MGNPSPRKPDLHGSQRFAIATSSDHDLGFEGYLTAHFASKDHQLHLQRACQQVLWVALASSVASCRVMMRFDANIRANR
jgi:hypothetical protein